MKQSLCHRMPHECRQRCTDMMTFLSHIMHFSMSFFFSYPQLIRPFSIEFHNEIPELAERTKWKRAVQARSKVMQF